MTSISNNAHIDKLHGVVAKYEPVDVKSSMYIESSNEINDKDSKFKVISIARIWKYKNNFAKGYVPNLPEKFFVIKKIKSTVPWTYVFSGLKNENFL